MYKVIVSGILALLLCGCGQEYQSYKFSNERFTPQMGVAIIDLSPWGTSLDLIKFANADGSYFNMINDNGYYSHAYHVDLSFTNKLKSITKQDGALRFFNKLPIVDSYLFWHPIWSTREMYFSGRSSPWKPLRPPGAP